MGRATACKERRGTVEFQGARRYLGIILAGGLCILLGRWAYSETPVYRDEPSGDFFRTWLLCGPFPYEAGEPGTAEAYRWIGWDTDYLASHGGEQRLRVQEGQTEPFEGGTARWILHESEGSVVDLDAAVSVADAVLAYGYCEIESEQKRAVVFAIGSNDSIKVWLNGEQLLDRPGPRGLTPDQDLIPAALRKGRNTLLVKVGEHGNKWQFCCRILPLVRENMEQLVPLFRVINDERDRAVLQFLPSKTLLGDVFKSGRIEVFSCVEPAELLSHQHWAAKQATVLKVDTKTYGEYKLRLKLAVAGWEELTMDMPFSAGKRVEHTLFTDGETDYSIVLGENASESEQWAAAELQHWLKEVSGADFPIHRETDKIGGPQIVVGFNKRARTILGSKSSAPEDSNESFTYRNIGQDIVIWGGRQRGTMYGVMSFLEREMGVRWYTPRVTAAPKKDRYTFVLLSHGETPGIRVRNDFYFEAFEPIWAARNRINGAMSHREQPGGLECYWAVHTFYPLMPPAEFFEAHPEYYSLISGKRTHDHAQLCLTNPDVLRIIIDRIKKVMTEQPQYLIYDVSQNDWHGACQCDNCQAIAKREESESGPVIWFVNQVAEAIEREFPDKFIGTLAYQYTRKPCKTLRPRHNVVVRLCSIECCFAHDFLSCPENESFVRDMKGWAAIAPHLYIWDYVVNFSHYIMPYPNFRVLQANLQFFRDHNAIGVMEQAAYQSRGGEFAELRAYVIAKLLWNPDCNVEDVINDFMYGYYGRSGQYVRKYFDLLHGRLTPETHIHLGLQPDDKLFSDEFVREAEELFDQAEIVADNEEVRRRVEVARLPILYLKCKRTPKQAVQDGTYARFTAITEREGITHYAESGAPHREAFHAEMAAAK